jgi:hypothetical protein
MIVDVSSALRPNNRKRTIGEALMNASTMGLERPGQSEMAPKL